VAPNEAQPPWEEIAERLDIAVRTPLFSRGSVAPLVGVAVAPCLMAYARLDGKEPVLASDATRWGKSFREILARALVNVGEEAPRLAADGGLFRLEACGDRAAARLLLPGFLDAVGSQTKAGAIYAIPDPGTCLIADDEDTLVRLYDAAFAAWHESDEPVSPVVYAAGEDAETFAPLLLPPGHRAEARARRAAAVLLGTVYADQRASLEDVEDAPILAPFEVAPHDEIGAVTCTIAVRDVEALLPVADLVMLRDPDDGDEARIVPRLLLEAAGLVVAAPDFDPPRFVLLRFPEPEELEPPGEDA
jgi:hypothetical protein